MGEGSSRTMVFTTLYRQLKNLKHRRMIGPLGGLPRPCHRVGAAPRVHGLPRQAEKFSRVGVLPVIGVDTQV